jgi:hypothetical protein
VILVSSGPLVIHFGFAHVKSSLSCDIAMNGALRQHREMVALLDVSPVI